ncbi:MAG: hypothetical protein P1P87_05760 [Trueperaceae bacterium]|nr:hypothetical protein [Trueperaceae bacterium]
MNRKLIIVTAAALLLGLALAQGHRFADTAPRGAAPGAQVQQVRGPAFAQPGAPAYGPQARWADMAARQQTAQQWRTQVGLQGAVDGVIAEQLGLTQEELIAAKAAGASIADLAAEKGIEIADLEAAFAAARAEAIEALLTEGAITELQAEQMAERGTEAFASLIAREGCAGGLAVGGEPLYANRTETARGPLGGAGYANRAPRGPGARW